MNLERLNQWLVLVANLGVLIGIIAVVYELRQTQTSLQAEAGTTRTQLAILYQDIYRENQVYEIELKLAAGQELTTEEFSRGLAWIQTIMRYFENLHFQRQLGVLDDEIWQANLNGIGVICVNPVFHASYPGWPDGFGPSVFRSSFVNLVTDICEQ